MTTAAERAGPANWSRPWPAAVKSGGVSGSRTTQHAQVGPLTVRKTTRAGRCCPRDPRHGADQGEADDRVEGRRNPQRQCKLEPGHQEPESMVRDVIPHRTASDSLSSTTRSPRNGLATTRPRMPMSEPEAGPGGKEEGGAVAGHKRPPPPSSGGEAVAVGVTDLPLPPTRLLPRPTHSGFPRPHFLRLRRGGWGGSRPGPPRHPRHQHDRNDQADRQTPA